MKTPEEIKQLLANHRNYTFNLQELLTDALALIEQHEKEKAALLKALKAADVYGECENCKHGKDADINCAEANYYCSACDADCKCKTCLNGSNWEWIGVQEEVDADG